MKVVYFLLAISYLGVSGQILYNDEGFVPQAYQVRWTNAGTLSGFPIVADGFFNVAEAPYNADIADNGNDDYPAIEEAIDDARDHTGMAIVYFPQGTYNIHSRIQLGPEHSNIVFQGDGPNSILKFSVGSSTQCFSIEGIKSETTHYIDDDIDKDSETVYVSTASSFTAGEWIRFSEYNHPLYNDNNNDDDETWAHGSVGQISQVESDHYNYIVLKDSASKDYDDSYDLRLWKITPVMRVGIENLKIQRNEGGQSAFGTNVFYEYAVDCWINGVESANTCRHHVDIKYSSHILISGSYFHHANDYGGGGRGYGVVLNFSTTNCLVENNIFYYLRHAVLVQAGANCNVFAYNYSTKQFWEDENYDYGPDLCIHGNYPYSNLFESNFVELIMADHTHGSNGRYDLYLRNRSYIEDEFFARPMTLLNSIKTGALGCKLGWEYYYQRIMANPYDFSVQFYGKEDQTYYSHNGTLDEILDQCHLQDISYYLNDRPYFFPTELEFPCIGPKPYEGGPNTPQTNPARERYDHSSVKTYLQFPTSFITTSGTLVNNEYWSGTVNLTGNVFVPDGITLTIMSTATIDAGDFNLTVNAGGTLNIDSGASLKFGANKMLRVYGELSAIGTSVDKITFDKSGSSKWYGIKFEDVSTDDASSIEYCDIKNATYGVYCFKSNQWIKYNTITNCGYGIYLYNPSPSGIRLIGNQIHNCNYDGINAYSGYPRASYNDISNCRNGIFTNFITGDSYIGGNDIYNNSQEGIRLFASSPSISENLIEDNSWNGVDCEFYSSPDLYYYSTGYNLITDNGYNGVYIESTSLPDLHGPSGSPNHIYSNGPSYYHVDSRNSSTINAVNNYWGGIPPNPNKFNGDVEYVPWYGYFGKITADVQESEPDQISQPMTEDYTFGLKSDPQAKIILNEAVELDKDDKSDEAIITLKTVISDYPASLEAMVALGKLEKCLSSSGERSQLESYLDETYELNKDRVIGGRILEMKIQFLLDRSSFGKAIEMCETIINDFPNTSLTKNASFRKWAIYFNDLKNYESAKYIMDQYGKEYGNNDDHLFMRMAMGEINSDEAKLLKESYKKSYDSCTKNEIPETFELADNYPNPFNPTTLITFSIPTENIVRLEVFNMRGQKVKTLVNGFMRAGNHEVEFDGQVLANGIYLYRIQAGDFQDVKKMILIK